MIIILIIILICIKKGGIVLEKEYDHWWQEGSNGDQSMEDSHQEGWKNVISKLDQSDIEGCDVLDFGCNQGGFLRVLYDTFPYRSGVGIDLAKKAIEIAQSRSANYPVTYYQTSNILSLGQTFQTVISTSVLYLIEDLDDHFSQIAQALTDGGVYYASFTDQSRNPSVNYMKEVIDKYGATKMQNHTLTEVVNKLVEQGFSVELRKEYTKNTYDVTHFSEFYLHVEDFVQSCEESYLIKATKEGKK